MKGNYLLLGGVCRLSEQMCSWQMQLQHPFDNPRSFQLTTERHYKDADAVVPLSHLFLLLLHEGDSGREGNEVKMVPYFLSSFSLSFSLLLLHEASNQHPVQSVCVGCFQKPQRCCHSLRLFSPSLFFG